MSEEDLNKQEDKAREDLKAADELLNDTTTKLKESLSGESRNKNCIVVAQMMLETAKAKPTEIMDHLADIRQKRQLISYWIRLYHQKKVTIRKGKVRVKKNREKKTQK